LEYVRTRGSLIAQLVAGLSPIVAQKEARELCGLYSGRHIFKPKIIGAVGA
jgi:hypothetical protein